jgi:hypothetical protein
MKLNWTGTEAMILMFEVIELTGGLKMSRIQATSRLEDQPGHLAAIRLLGREGRYPQIVAALEQ